MFVRLYGIQEMFGRVGPRFNGIAYSRIILLYTIASKKHTLYNKETKAWKRRIILHYTTKKLQPIIPTGHYGSAPVIIKHTQTANYIHWTNKAHTS